MAASQSQSPLEPWTSAVSADHWLQRFGQQVVRALKPLVPPLNSHPDFALTLTVTIRSGRIRVTPQPRHYHEEGWRDTSR